MPVCLRRFYLLLPGESDAHEDDDDVDWEKFPNLTNANLEKMLRESMKLIATRFGHYQLNPLSTSVLSYWTEEKISSPSNGVRGLKDWDLDGKICSFYCLWFAFQANQMILY